MLDINYISEEIDAIGTQRSLICKPEQCPSILCSSSGSIKILHLNIRSINRNVDELRLFLVTIEILPEVIILSECWLRKNPILPIMEGYLSYKTNNNRNQNDGLVIYIKLNLRHSITEPIFSDANCLLCTLHSNNLVIIALYRSPSIHNTESFLDGLNNLLTSNANFRNIVVMGDLNINISPLNPSPHAHEYLTVNASHGLLPTHTLSTRDKSCLDHVLLKSDFKTLTLVFDTHITDHAPVLLNIETKLRFSKRRMSRVQIDYSSVYASVLNTDFNQVFNTSNADMAAEYLVSKISQIINQYSIIKHIPSKNKLIKPWITLGLLRCIRNRNAMARKLKTQPNNYNLKVTYVRYRNFCNKLLKNLKLSYEKQEFTKAKSNPKATWKVIKSIINTDCAVNPPLELLNLEPSNALSVNSVNQFFANIGNNLAQKYINRPTYQSKPTDKSSPPDSLALLPTDESEVATIIFSLRRDAAAGWDGITAGLLQQCSNRLVPIITHICNICIESGKFPKVFKRAIVHPIYKGGNRDNVNNYRPISVLPVLSKVLEKILNSRLVSFLEHRHILAPNQFGFRARKSTEDAVASLVDHIVDKLDNQKKCVGIFLDLTKAFDTVSVPHLLTKLEGMGIRGHTLEIFKDYLSDRTQCVKIDSFVSDDTSLAFGVPQGSVLGPTLFLAYINSLCKLSLPNCSIFTYADDTALIIHDSNWRSTIALAEQALGNVMNWLADNLLTLNLTKTTYLTFSLTSSNQPSSESLVLKAHSCTTTAPYSLCDCPTLTRADTIKYLGVYIDSHLNWKYHLGNLKSRVRKLIYIFKKLRLSADTKILKTIYFALCQSILGYCISVWGGAAKTSFLELERAQRAVLKVMTRKPFRYPTSVLYDECQILTVRQLFVLQTVLRKHTTLLYEKGGTKKRRSYKVCPVERFRTTLASRHYRVIGSHLYNILNEHCNIYPLCKHACKNIVIKWLMLKTYAETEDLLILSIL